MRANELAFSLGIGSLFTHELDAIPNHEWRVLPLVRALPDEHAMLLFIAAHVPLFGVLVGFVSSPNPNVRTVSRLGVSAFLVLHGALHALSSGGSSHEFSSTLSRLLIFGGSTFGALHLVLEARNCEAHGAPDSSSAA